MHIPEFSASATLAQDYNGKYYYYDDSNTSKIPEGEYYILVDEPSKSSSTDNTGTQSNEIIVGEPSKYQDKLGERYIEIYKSSELLFNNEDSFNQSINNRKAETKENFGWFGNKTSYLIHGGTDYEDNCGIDLSEYSEDFFKYLEYIVKEKYRDKLYKVAGNIPIRLIVKYGANYLDDLANSPIGFLIGKIESRNDYGTYNYKHNGRYRAKYRGGIDRLTVAEVMAKHASGEIYAAGRFQVIPSTLKKAVTFLGIDTKKQFDKEMQDYICSKYLLTEKQPDIKAYLFGDGDIHQAMLGLAREFASFPVPNGMKLKSQRISDGTKSYYDGDGHNHALTSYEEVYEALEKTKYGG